MIFKTSLSLFIIFFIFNNIFALGKHDSSALTNIKKVELIDKPYRTIAILPFNNNTGDDHQAYIGKSIPKFIGNHLSMLDKIIVTTNDFQTPEKYSSRIITNYPSSSISNTNSFTNLNTKTTNSTNTYTRIIYSYGTNYEREVVIMNPEKTYKHYFQSPDPDDLHAFSKKIKADYLIYGSYKYKSLLKNQYLISYNIYNATQDKTVYGNRELLQLENIEQKTKIISAGIIQFFHPRDMGYIKLVTDISNYELFLDNKFIYNTTNIFKLKTGKHSIRVYTLKQYRYKTNFNVTNNKTNIIKFFKRHLEIQNAVLKVISEPTNATVYLNVNILGQSPLVSTNILPGEYRLKIIKSNYRPYFNNLKLVPGTNLIEISMEKLHPQEYYEERHKKNKMIMYTSLGIGSAALLASYFFYAEKEFAEDAFNHAPKLEDRIKWADKMTLYNNLTLISSVVGILSLSTSLYYFFKVIDYEDQDIGFNINDSIPEYAYTGNEHKIYLKYKF